MERESGNFYKRKIKPKGQFILNLFVGCLTVFIAYLQLQESHQEEKIQKFDMLLQTSHASLDTLNEILKTLNSQFIINERTQYIANENSKLIRQANANELYLAGISIINLRGDWYEKDMDSVKRYKENNYLEKVQIILNSQSKNQFLLDNDTLYAKWRGFLDFISFSLDMKNNNSHPFPLQDWEERAFYNEYDALLKLGYEVTFYCIQSDEMQRGFVHNIQGASHPNLDPNQPLNKVVNGKVIPLDSMERAETFDRWRKAAVASIKDSIRAYKEWKKWHKHK